MHLRKHSSDKNICYYILKLNYGYRHYGEQMINYFMIWMLNGNGKFSFSNGLHCWCLSVTTEKAKDNIVSESISFHPESAMT